MTDMLFMVVVNKWGYGVTLWMCGRFLRKVVLQAVIAEYQENDNNLLEMLELALHYLVGA